MSIPNLTTTSFTPRVNINQNWWGMPVKAIAGVDLYRTDYESDRSLFIGLHADPSVSTASRNRSQATAWLTLALLPTTDVSVGGRIQRTQTQIGDIYDPFARRRISASRRVVRSTKLRPTESWHLGFEHRFDDNFAMFGRAATSFRVPNVDERIGNGAIVFPLPPPTFALQYTDIGRLGRRHQVRASASFCCSPVVYRMNLQNELHLSARSPSPISISIRRGSSGVETLMTWSVTDWLRLKGNVTYHAGAVSAKVRSPAISCRWCRAGPAMPACRWTSGRNI